MRANSLGLWTKQFVKPCWPIFMLVQSVIISAFMGGFSRMAKDITDSQVEAAAKFTLIFMPCRSISQSTKLRSELKIIKPSVICQGEKAQSFISNWSQTPKYCRDITTR